MSYAFANINFVAGRVLSLTLFLIHGQNVKCAKLDD